MKTALIKFEKREDGSVEKLDIRIVDKLDLKEDWMYFQRVESSFCSFLAIEVKHVHELFTDPFISDHIIRHCY